MLFTPRAQSRFLDLGLPPRGCRPKSRRLPGRVEVLVIQPVVRACTTFWLTSTLTRVHRTPKASSPEIQRFHESVQSVQNDVILVTRLHQSSLGQLSWFQHNFKRLKEMRHPPLKRLDFACFVSCRCKLRPDQKLEHVHVTIHNNIRASNTLTQSMKTRAGTCGSWDSPCALTSGNSSGKIAKWRRLLQRLKFGRDFSFWVFCLEIG